MSESLFDRACARAPQGMEISVIAAEHPERIALWSDQETMTFAALNARANQLARRLRAAGVANGDAIALVCSNRMEFAVVRFAAHRTGLRLTPINWHLAPEEIIYIVENCEARALFLDTRIAPVAPLCAALPTLRIKVSVGGELQGYLPWEQALAGQDETDIDDPLLGGMMLYTSGTTGRPKGVYRHQSDPALAASMQQLLTAVFQFDPDSGKDRALATGPLYHAGPFNLCLTTPLTAGIGAVLMDKWEPERMLALIDEHKITHSFCVPTMFNRLLHLPEETRQRHAVSSLRFIIHGAAPCSVDTKQRMLDWFGPIIWEMFAGTEGQGTIVSPQEWLARPGTVGRAMPGQVRIVDEAGKELPAGETGLIYLHNPRAMPFEYFKDPAKTRAAMLDEHFTAGDIGYLDADGYLFLTGRSAEVIISGGINLYPQEIDDVLVQHPAVADVACVGVPNEDLGEEIRAVVVLRPGHQANAGLTDALLDFCDQRLARQKWPRSFDFVEALPRSEAGKLLRNQIRSRYWADRTRQI